MSGLGNRLAEPDWDEIRRQETRVRQSVLLAYEVGWRAWNHALWVTVPVGGAAK